MAQDPYGRGQAAAVPKNLSLSLEQIVEESQALRRDLASSEQARKRMTQIGAGVVVVFTIIVGLLMAAVWQNNQVLGQVNQLTSTMADCTTPGGKCYEEGRVRTGGAISDVIRASVFMSQCARLYPGEVGEEYDRKLEACVAERLAKATAARQPGSGVSPSPSTGAPPSPPGR